MTQKQAENLRMRKQTKTEADMITVYTRVKMDTGDIGIVPSAAKLGYLYSASVKDEKTGKRHVVFGEVISILEVLPAFSISMYL